MVTMGNATLPARKWHNKPTHTTTSHPPALGGHTWQVQAQCWGRHGIVRLQAGRSVRVKNRHNSHCPRSNPPSNSNQILHKAGIQKVGEGMVGKKHHHTHCRHGHPCSLCPSKGQKKAQRGVGTRHVGFLFWPGTGTNTHMHTALAHNTRQVGGCQHCGGTHKAHNMATQVGQGRAHPPPPPPSAHGCSNTTHPLQAQWGHPTNLPFPLHPPHPPTSSPGAQWGQVFQETVTR